MSNPSDFYSVLHTSASRNKVANLYGSRGWEVRKCAWHDYEVTCEWAELVIEGESPILMHGVVDEGAARAEELVAPLRTAGIVFLAEFYGPKPARELLLTLRSDTPGGART